MTSASSRATTTPGRRPLGTGARRGIKIGVLVVVLLGVVLGTKAVPMDSELLQSEEAFDAEAFGAENFPAVQEQVVANAVPATELASAISADREAAVSEYAQQSSGGPVFPVTLTGTVGDGNAGIYTVNVEGLADDLTVRVQTGPAINGTELRDVTGSMPFGDFQNQIQYQNAAAALNEQLKKQVLADIDTENLKGKTITVTGAFTLVNPQGWLITPVQLEVQ